MNPFAKALVVAGLTLLLVGLLLHFLPSVPILGKLPGDIRIERPEFRLYVPITTCVLVSLLFSALFWLFRKLH